MKVTAFSGLVAAVTVAVFAAQGETKGLEHKSALPARRHHAKNAMMLQKRGKFTGRATWYGIHAGDMGACGTELSASDYGVALNEGQYGSLNSQSSYCGKTITITDGKKTTTAKIVDACPKGTQCHWGALDMSRSLFSFFNDFGVGEFDITWWVNGEGGSSGSSGSDSSSSSSSSSNNNNNDDDDDDDDSTTTTAASKAASRVAETKKKSEAAAEKKKEAAAEKKKEEEAAAEKKKEAAKKKKEAAEKKKEKEEAAAAAKVQKTQQQNLAAFGQIMETLNNIVTQAAGPTSTSVDSSVSPSASSVSSVAAVPIVSTSSLPSVAPASSSVVA